MNSVIKRIIPFVLLNVLSIKLAFSGNPNWNDEICYYKNNAEACRFISQKSDGFIDNSGLVSSNSINLAAGEVTRLENFQSNYVDARHVDVWLPDGYDDNKKYAVLYMHDGQMLFDSTTTWNKQEWKVDETVGRLTAEQKIKDCIVVGIWNNGQKRHMEYFPQKAVKYLPAGISDSLVIDYLSKKPAADNYLKFITKELKPFIDGRFSTLLDKQNTFIAGSSMGGMISMYAFCEYPEIFGGAACLSTHWTGIYSAAGNPIPYAVQQYMKDHLPDPQTHKIYFDLGTNTLDSLFAPFQEQVDAILREKGYTDKNWKTLVFEGENHSERSWSRRLHIPLQFLMPRN